MRFNKLLCVLRKADRWVLSVSTDQEARQQRKDVLADEFVPHAVIRDDEIDKVPYGIDEM